MARRSRCRSTADWVMVWSGSVRTFLTTAVSSAGDLRELAQVGRTGARPAPPSGRRRGSCGLVLPLEMGSRDARQRAWADSTSLNIIARVAGLPAPRVKWGCDPDVRQRGQPTVCADLLKCGRYRVRAPREDVEIPGELPYADVVGLGSQSWFPAWEPAGGEDFDRGEEDREVRSEAPSEAPASPPRSGQDWTDREPSAGVVRTGRQSALHHHRGRPAELPRSPPSSPSRNAPRSLSRPAFPDWEPITERAPTNPRRPTGPLTPLRAFRYPASRISSVRQSAPEGETPARETSAEFGAHPPPAVPDEEITADRISSRPVGDGARVAGCGATAGSDWPLLPGRSAGRGPRHRGIPAAR